MCLAPIYDCGAGSLRSIGTGVRSPEAAHKEMPVPSDTSTTPRGIWPPASPAQGSYGACYVSFAAPCVRSEENRQTIAPMLASARRPEIAIASGGPNWLASVPTSSCPTGSIPHVSR